MEIVLHSATKRAVDDFISKPSHSLLLSAPMGSGKLYLAQHIAARLLDVEQGKVQDNPYYLLISPVDGTITIEAIRELKSFVHLKTTGTRPIRRVLVIEQANAMTTEAQNALLKLLEEPPADTVIILTADSTHVILATILSRLQRIVVQRPTEEALMNLFGDTSDNIEVKKAYHMSNGRIGLMKALLEPGEEAHPLAEYIDIAKDLLRKTAYERLLMVNQLATEDIDMLCRGLYSVSHAAFVSATEKGNETHIKRWYHSCNVIHKTQDQLRFNPQSKLLLTHLFISL